MSNLVMTSDQILASARTFIVAGGYNGFSYADIAGEVGIRKASIHHHFPSKVDLVRTLVARHRERTEASMADLESKFPDPLALLQTYADYWAKCIEDASVRFASARCLPANSRRCRLKLPSRCGLTSVSVVLVPRSCSGAPNRGFSNSPALPSWRLRPLWRPFMARCCPRVPMATLPSSTPS